VTTSADTRPVVWLVEHEDVCTIWTATRQVFGNSLWHSDVDEALDTDRYRQFVDLVEARSGQSLFDCVLDAVAGLYPGDPSEVFAALHRAFTAWGVDLQFSDHYRYGDVLARAAAVAGGAAVEQPARVHHVDEDVVVDIWDAAVNHGLEDFRPDDFYDGDLMDDLETVYGAPITSLTRLLVEDHDADADPSLFFRNLHRFGTDRGIEITFAPHPEHGDLLARAEALGE